MTGKIESTEHIDPTWQGLDLWSAEMLSDRLCSAQLNALQCMHATHDQIAAAGSAGAERLQQSNNGRLVYCGAGSAGAQACVDGLELPGTFGWSQNRLALLLAGGWESFYDFGGAVEDDIQLAQSDAKNLHFTADDVLIAVSASGSTAYTIKIMDIAQASGALIIGICNNAPSAMQGIADKLILLNSGSEAIAGSTRMAAGSAQKVALNSLSTLIMAKLGYLYDNLMVRLRVSNKKLLERAIIIVKQISNCTDKEAKEYLEAADYHVAEAILMAHGMSSVSAKMLLKQQGSLRVALQTCAQH